MFSDQSFIFSWRRKRATTLNLVGIFMDFLCLHHARVTVITQHQSFSILATVLSMSQLLFLTFCLTLEPAVASICFLCGRPAFSQCTIPHFSVKSPQIQNKSPQTTQILDRFQRRCRQCGIPCILKIRKYENLYIIQLWKRQASQLKCMFRSDACGTEHMVLMVKCLPHKHEDLSQILRILENARTRWCTCEMLVLVGRIVTHLLPWHLG